MITLLMPVPLRMKIMNRACRDKNPLWAFLVGHTLEMTGVVHRCFFRIFLALICMKYFVQ